MISRREKECSGWETRASESGYNRKNRAILIDWMAEFCKDHGLHRQTLHLAANLLDRYVSSKCGSSVTRHDLQLLGLSALILSIKNTVDMSVLIECRRRVA